MLKKIYFIFISSSISRNIDILYIIIVVNDQMETETISLVYSILIYFTNYKQIICRFH